MANRQYIGARYVPKFFDNNGSSDWVSGISYEALTIVTYMYNSYTSRKPVPSNIGSPNENPDYWVNTGDYTGLVNNLQERVANVEEEIEDIGNRTYATPEMFGASHSGDATDELQELLNSDYNYIKINGEYTVSALTIPNDKVIVGDKGVINVTDKITIDTKHGIKIDNVTFNGIEEGQEIVLKIANSNNITVSNCTFTGTYGGDIVGYGIVDVRNCNECYFLNDTIHGSNCEGLLIHNSKHCVVRGGKYYDNLRGSGVHVGGLDGDDHGYHVIDGVECYNNAGSNIGISGKQNVCVNCFIHDNDSTTFAIVLGHEGSGGSKCVVANNVILRCNSGIYTYGATDVVIDGNVIDNAGKVNPITPYENNGISASANSYNVVASNNTIRGCTNAIVGVALAVGNIIDTCTHGVAKNANVDIKTDVKDCTITNCTDGLRFVRSAENCEISTAQSCILGEGKFVGNTLTSGGIAIYEGSSSDVSFITNNIITSVDRAIYSSKTGVFEYNMLLGSNVISASNMTATNNYDFTTP